MYEVKKYYDGEELFYGVYIKTSGNMYGKPARDCDNLVVLCRMRDIAIEIKNLLEKDHVIEEYGDGTF